MRKTILGATLLAMLLGGAAAAQEPAWNWTGFYLGGHVGATSANTIFSDPAGSTIFGGDVNTPGFMAGFQLGYDWQFAPRWLAGLQVDASLLSSQGTNTCLQSSTAIIGADCRLWPRSLATFTGRLGFLPEPSGRTLVYGKGGLAWLRADLSINPNGGFDAQPDPGSPATASVSAWGWTVGAGVEHAVSPRWSLSAEYDYLRFAGLRVTTPATVAGEPPTGIVEVPAASSGLTINQHVFKMGLNYRWGAGPKPASEAAVPPDRSTWAPTWEFELGARYWYSSGNFRNSNGGQASTPISRLSYVDMTGHSGEVFARLDSPYEVFVKAFAGGGFIAGGTLYDEDWGNAAATGGREGYSLSASSLSGSFNYFTGDLGVNVLHGPDYKAGLFVGYNRFQVVQSGFGCAQIANDATGVCAPPYPSGRNSLSELDTWQSLRVGTSLETKIFDRLKIGGDFAFLPYVVYDGLDIHHLRVPPKYFPVRGTGQGFQVEVILSWQATEALSIGIGGRYWALWTTNALQTDAPDSFTSNTDRYGVFVQAAYKFGH